MNSDGQSAGPDRAWGREGADASRPDRALWGWTGVLVATLLAYWPMLRGRFIWDDDSHVTKESLRSLHGLGRIWFEVGATQQYYPVLHSAFWLEHWLWGDAPVGYHLANVFLHATAACLFAAALRRLGQGEGFAWLAAFLFALHPVGVESVAWISEQKNTLSTVFYLLAALTYLTWREGLPRAVGTGGLYFLASLFFVLALLSKSVTATLPAALLVILWWRHGRLTWRQDVLPLLPWFVLGAAAGLFTAWVERTYIGAEGAGFSLSLLQRCLLAGRAAWFYLGKLVWPENLLFVYPHWSIDPAAGWSYLFALGALAVVAALWCWRRRSRGPLAGALFFLGTLFPALGFFNVYPFLFSYVADHFQYLASLGIIALAVGAWARWARSSVPLACAIVGLLGALTWQQCRLYRDPELLYRYTLAKNPGAWLLQGELGNILLERGQLAGAEALYAGALRTNPDYFQGHNNLGDILLNTGRVTAAIAQFREALRLRPASAEAHVNLGSALAQLGRLPEAIAEYQRALQLDPRSPEAQNDLGNALSDAGRQSAAIAHYEAALRLNARYFQAQNGLGVALFRSGDIVGAATHYDAALRLDPAYAQARYNLGNALARLGRLPEAIEEYRQGVALRPEWAELRYSLGVALAKSRRLPEAIEEYRAALRLKPGLAEAHANLGGALANDGRLVEAVDEYKKALQLSPRDAPVHYNLGLALQLLGRGEEARAQFEEASRLGGVKP